MGIGIGLAGRGGVELGLAQGGGTVAVPWYRAGGAPAPVAAYLAKGAASQAASYANLVTPGTYDLTTTSAPTWDATNGWTGGGTKYLNTGITPANDQTWAMLVRYTGATASQTMLGVYSGSDRFFALAGYYFNTVTYWAGNAKNVSPALASGVIGLAGNKGYRNGVAESGTIPAGAGSITHAIYLLARNTTGTATEQFSGSIQAYVVWNTATDAATWLPLVAAAMAAL